MTMYGYNIAAKYIFSSYLLPYISVLICKWFCHKICCGCFIFCHQLACIGHFNFCFICCCFYLFSFSFCRMYSVCQKGQHANLKKNSDYGEQQTDYSVSKCGDRGQTLRWQYSRSTNLSSEGNGKEYDLFKLPLLISIR